MLPHTTILYVTPNRSKTFFTSLPDGLDVEIRTFRSIEELFPLLSDHKFSSDIIAIDVEHFFELKGATIFDVINTLKTLINCTVYRSDQGKPKKRSTKIIGVASDTTDVSLIKEISKLLDGMCVREGGTITFEEARDNFAKILDGDLTVPKQIQNLLKNKKQTKTEKNSIMLTPRQRQIYRLVTEKGASNKAIGKMLDISESTVKLHMTAVLKKYGVRNRTQLAVFGNQNSSTDQTKNQSDK